HGQIRVLQLRRVIAAVVEVKVGPPIRVRVESRDFHRPTERTAEVVPVERELRHRRDDAIARLQIRRVERRTAVVVVGVALELALASSAATAKDKSASAAGTASASAPAGVAATTTAASSAL